MRPIHKFLAVALSAGSCLAAKAQQPATYTQYMNNLTPLNATYSLLDKAGSLNVIGRKQWSGVEGAPETFILSANAPLEKLRASIGLNVMHDKVGIEKQTSVSAYFAKSIQLNKSTFMSASFNAGIRSYKAPYSHLDPSDAAFKTDISESNGIMGIGLMLYNPDKFYLGASLPAMGISKKEKDREIKNTFYFSGAYLHDLGGGVKVKPAALVTYTKNMKTQEDVSVTFYMLDDMLGLGANYRSTKEVAGILSFAFKNNLQLGYSYQTGVGEQRVSTLSNSTHEISLSFRFGKDLKPKLL